MAEETWIAYIILLAVQNAIWLLIGFAIGKMLT